jgi:hypothetical protein
MDGGSICGQWLDDLGTDDQSLLDDQDASIVVVNARVVSARGDCHQVIRESLNAVWANGVGTNHHAQVVSLEERVQVVRTEVHDVVLLLRISHVVVLEAVLFLSLVRVTPEKV